jgi:hypothetical protein
MSGGRTGRRRMHIMVDQTAEEPLVDIGPERNPVEDHIALIYEQDEERLTTITPLIKVGLEKGELCLYVSNEEDDQAIVEALKAENIDVDKAVSNGSLITFVILSIVSKDNKCQPTSLYTIWFI